MGRIRRQRRYKSCDPFSRQKQSVDEKVDLPPKRKEVEDDHFMETKSYQIFQNKLEKGSRTKKKRKANAEDVVSTKKIKKSGKTEQVDNSMEKLPNESRKKYFARLDQNVQHAINNVMKETKTIRKKRKEHLKNRDEKKKKQKNNMDSDKLTDFNSLKDDVRFGEVVDAPPIISAAPRNTPKEKRPYGDLKLASLFKTESKPTDESSKKKRKDMTLNEKETFDEERQKAIDAYRLIKKRKESMREYKNSLT